MKLAQIVADGRPGGGTTVLLSLIDEIQPLAQCSLTVVSQPGSYLQSEVERRGLEFIGLDFFTAMMDIRLPWRLAHALKGRHFDMTHLHGLRAAHHAVQWPSRSVLGHLIYTVHGLHQLHLSALIRYLANRADRQVFSRVSRCVFVSQADRMAAERWGLMAPGTQSDLIPNGIDLGLMGSRQQRRAEFDVAFIGRFDEPKDPMTAARVLAALSDKGYRCAMAGDGRLQSDCRSLLHRLKGGERVQLLGALGHEQALDLIANVGVLVMPSRWEGLPVLPMEAMALRTPLVASRIAGIEEVMPVGHGGLLVELDDIAAMIAAVQTLLHDTELRKRCLDAGTARVKSCFDRKAMARRYLDVYQQVMA